MKKGLLLVTMIFLSATAPAQTIKVDPIRIEIGQDYEKYSNEELRRRVWQLERAVAQLQDQVFQLALNNGGGSTRPYPAEKRWTCYIESFGKTHTSSGETKVSALAQVLKKCADATSAVHCREEKAKCDNE